MALLNPRVDLAFKKIFGIDENKDLLISFINSIVSKEHQVASIELLNPYNSKNFEHAKGSILDIKAKDEQGKQFDIEIQISDEGDYDKRALFYWAKLYADQLNSGHEYSSLGTAIGIHILNFNCIPNLNSYYNQWRITDKNSGQHYFQDFAIYTIELNKFTDQDKEDVRQLLPRIRTGLDRWAAFLTKAADLDRNNLPKEINDPNIKKALDVLTVTSLNKEEREIYENHLKWLRTEASTLKKLTGKAREEGRAVGRTEGRAEGRAKGRVEGRAEGKLEERKSLLQTLIQNGFSRKQISQALHLTLQEIDDLLHKSSR